MANFTPSNKLPDLKSVVGVPRMLLEGKGWGTILGCQEDVQGNPGQVVQ